MNDYSTYLEKPGMLAYIESEWLKNRDIHVRQSSIVNDVANSIQAKSVLEIGCSTGNTAGYIPTNIYCGVDASLASLFLALLKNPGKKFIHSDVRKLEIDKVNLVFTFAVLKHFSLEEWPNIFSKILSLGDHAIFDIPVDEENKDDGEYYHHVWLTKDFIKEQVKLAGHKIISVYDANTTEPIFLTKRL